MGGGYVERAWGSEDQDRDEQYKDCEVFGDKIRGR